jgi:dynein light intermediate chain
MIPPINSLVRYENPVLVSTTKQRKGRAAKAATLKPGAATAFHAPQADDILNSILPPR